MLILAAALALGCTNQSSESGGEGGGTNPGFPGAGAGDGADEMLGNSFIQCFYSEADPDVPLATIEYAVPR